MFTNTIVMNLAASVEIIASLFSWAPTMPYSAIFAVLNPNSLTTHGYTASAARDLVVIRGGGTSSVDEEREKEEGDGEGKCCWESAHFRLPIELQFNEQCPSLYGVACFGILLVNVD